uniref:Uncharacterized protein n=1 Tax=Arundo donax TaxID=35708 RepID=A0A0A9GLB6_ARUDO
MRGPQEAASPGGAARWVCRSKPAACGELVTQDRPPTGSRRAPSLTMSPPPQSGKLAAGAAESASALTLQELDVSSMSGLFETAASEESITAISGTVAHSTANGSLNSPPLKFEKCGAGAAEFASSQTMQDPDGASSKELPAISSLEKSIIANAQTASHDTIDGSSSTFPSSREKHVAGAAKCPCALALQEADVISFLDEFHDNSSEESIAASPRTVPHNTTDDSPQSASSLGSNILIRRPPNCYQVFYVRMDPGGGVTSGLTLLWEDHLRAYLKLTLLSRTFFMNCGMEQGKVS